MRLGLSCLGADAPSRHPARHATREGARVEQVRQGERQGEDVKMIYPKFIQNRSQEVPGHSGHQKTFRRDPENIFLNIEDSRVF